MKFSSKYLGWLLVPLAMVLLFGDFQSSQAYVEAPMSLGAVVQQSSHIMLLQVEKVDREKNLIIYRKIRDIKGKHPTDLIKHNIGRGGLRPNEWKVQMDWAEPGKLAVFFHNGGASETCIGMWWYQAYAGGEWWNHSHGEPFLLRSYAGSPEKLATLVAAMLAGQEVVVPCMVDGNKDELHNRRAKIQRLRASLKLQDYNPKRDFVGWGGEDFRRLAGMPGFTHYSALSRVDPEAQAISCVDVNGDGKLDLCLVGGSKVVLLQNGGEALNEMPLPYLGGCRAAVWADYNADGKPDLLLATATGPKLFTNTGEGFRDDSYLIPKTTMGSVTAAAWLDYDGDGLPDILLANGYHGLRLYRNQGQMTLPPGPVEPRFGKWHYIGPFDNAGNRGFDTVYPVEREIDLSKSYPGKNGEKAVWKEGNFKDGDINSLMLFQQNNEAVVYLYREIEVGTALEMPVSLGSDDTLTVWLNDKKIHAENTYRACAPDQARLKLALQPGKNKLLMKICQGGGDWAFYFKAQGFDTNTPIGTWFEDVSISAGLGTAGIGSGLKGDSLTVSDVNGNGRPDVLYGAGQGLLLLNTRSATGDAIFTEQADSGIRYRPGKVGPVFGDFNNDGIPDLFIPQKDQCQLYQGDGKGGFIDVTAKAGDLAKPIGWATSAVWGDFDNDGHLDLFVGCLLGPNRFFRNRGDGTFEDATEAIGLHQRIFNTQALTVADLNQDGVLDLILNNEGQESAVLLGNREVVNQRTPVTIQVAGTKGVIGSQVRITDPQGKTLARWQISGGDGRGGQMPPLAHFALPPGPYRVQVMYSSGATAAQDITVADSPLRSVVGDSPMPSQP
ncbi:MAG: FG-GAP repeat domain-containing protein [Gemmataceae bacterium]